jgi:hypothetical protein
VGAAVVASQAEVTCLAISKEVKRMEGLLRGDRTVWLERSDARARWRDGGSAAGVQVEEESEERPGTPPIDHRKGGEGYGRGFC